MDERLPPADELRQDGMRQDGMHQDGMRITFDVPIPMDDGVVLRADLFRPDDDGRHPVILSYGAFGKGLAFQDGNASAWERLVAAFPEVLRGSSGRYQVWEVVDPERWVPDGYACLRIDARGAGRSPGFLDPWSPRETRDIAACIAWAATQPWCNGRVGMNGISYFAMNQWQVAALQPPGLAAICVWEGAADFYRDACRHGGIYCGFMANLYPRAFHRVQHGLGERGLRSRVTGDWVSGPETLSDEELAANRIDIARFILDRPFDGPDYRARNPDFSTITVPLLSAANWGGQGLHPRGNFEGFAAAASSAKWLEAHGHAHWSHFYSDYGVALQKRFFGHFLKDQDTGWDHQPTVQIQVRHPGEHFVERHETGWPLPRTRWTTLHLDLDRLALSEEPPAAALTRSYAALGPGLAFSTPPLAAPLEITGPVAARLFVSSSTTDADLFLVLQVFDPQGREVTFIGANDPRTPVGLGWLRASHRKRDPDRSTPWRPWHTHDEVWPLVPGEPVALDIEIWPTSIVVPPGHRLVLAVRGRDYEAEGPPPDLPGVKYTLTGVGPFRHDDPEDRPEAVFGGTVTLHAAPDQAPFLLLPVIPPA